MDEVPLSDREQESSVPAWFRWAMAVIACAMILPAVVYLIRFTISPALLVSPKELNLDKIALFGVLILLLAIAPWDRLGLRIKKVGWLEFDRISRGQATESAVELTEIRTRLDEVESRVRSQDTVATIAEHFGELEVIPLLVRFLTEHQPRAFSPMRVRDWGARQSGFERLGKVSLSEMRRMLQKLVADGMASTAVSRMGNTLYRSPRT
jgi:hypothetical protein